MCTLLYMYIHSVNVHVYVRFSIILLCMLQCPVIIRIATIGFWRQ